MKKRVLFIVTLAIGLSVFLTFYLNQIKASKDEGAGLKQDLKHSEKNRSTSVAQQTEEPPTVEIPVEKQQLMGVRTMVVKPKQVQKSLRTVGRIVYDEKKIFTINTKYEGWIEKLYADYTGRYVKKGEAIAEIYSPELFATQMEFINLLKWATPKTDNRKPMADSEDVISEMLSKDAGAIIEAAKQRLRLLDITEEQIEKIAETGRPIKTLTIYSPASGYVVQKPVVQGMRVMPGEKILDIVDLSMVWIIADIYEYELPLVDVNQEADITLSYIPNKVFRAKVEFVYPSLSEETRTAKIRFSIPNKDGLLKPQMFTEVTIKRNLGRRLIIPEEAVIDTGKRRIVYVDKGEGYFEPREILPGLRVDGSVEVLRGLKAGERIAVSGNFLIDSEARLKGIVK